jgi:hypothetical protein
LLHKEVEARQRHLRDLPSAVAVRIPGAERAREAQGGEGQRETFGKGQYGAHGEREKALKLLSERQWISASISAEKWSSCRHSRGRLSRQGEAPRNPEKTRQQAATPAVHEQETPPRPPPPSPNRAAHPPPRAAPSMPSPREADVALSAAPLYRGDPTGRGTHVHDDALLKMFLQLGHPREPLLGVSIRQEAPQAIERAHSTTAESDGGDGEGEMCRFSALRPRSPSFE